MSKKLLVIVSVLMVAVFVLSACAKAQEPAAPKFTACEVTDTGGIDDKSFNATAWKGIQDAVKELGIEGKILESTQAADYEKNINAFVEEKCDLIVTVGFLLGDATKAGAEANPDTKFTIVDYAYDPTLPNVVGQVFNTDEAAFAAGYLAAGMSKSGKVGTFGGMQIPPVTIFMDGFYYGVQYYNAQKGTAVEVLGWDPAAGTGLFTNNFEDQTMGNQYAVQLMDQGADVIMPVAGPVGIGAAAAVKDRGNVLFIGVDSDWFETQPGYASVILTSVLKKMDAVTVAVIKTAMDGTFAGGVSVGSLANGGVGIAPYHDLDGQVPAELKAEIETILKDVAAGTLKVKP
jgi:basic membrane protein A